MPVVVVALADSVVVLLRVLHVLRVLPVQVLPVLRVLLVRVVPRALLRVVLPWVDSAVLVA